MQGYPSKDIFSAQQSIALYVGHKTERNILAVVVVAAGDLVVGRPRVSSPSHACALCCDVGTFLFWSHAAPFIWWNVVVSVGGIILVSIGIV